MHRHGGDIYRNQNKIDYSANINFLGMPQAVRQAAKDAIDDAVHYPDSFCEALKQAIAEKEGVPAEWIFCGNGAADVIFTLMLAEKPKEALLPIPSFYEYRQALESVACQIRTHLLLPEHQFCVQRDILEALKKRPDLLILCNPNNPTGQLLDQELSEEIAVQCQRQGTRLLMDECFSDFLEDAEKHTLLSKVAENPQIFILRAFTKMYGMAGLRLGYGICSDVALIRRMEAVSQPWNVSVPAQAAGIAAVKETAFVEKSRALIAEQKAYLLEGLQKADVKVFGSAANYIFFRAEEGLEKAMREAGFLIRDCGNFDGLTEGYYRIAVRGREENEKFLEALKKRTQNIWQNQL